MVGDPVTKIEDEFLEGSNLSGFCLQDGCFALGVVLGVEKESQKGLIF